MTNLEALRVVHHRPLVLAGLAAVDYVTLRPFLKAAASSNGPPKFMKPERD